MFIAVDLPEPDGPMTATNSPRAIVKSMPLSAVDGGVAAAVDLGDVAKRDERRGHLSPPCATR